jgi:hypothetical protein
MLLHWSGLTLLPRTRGALMSGLGYAIVGRISSERLGLINLQPFREAIFSKSTALADTVQDCIRAIKMPRHPALWPEMI